MKYWYLLVVVMGLAACAGPDKSLQVKQFYLRDQHDDKGDDPFLRGEKARLLYGAVSMKERKDRLGQYYTILWSDTKGGGKGKVEVLFEFQQGKTASLVKKRVSEFSAETLSGKAAFSVIGDDYFKNGRVLAWKVSLLRGGRVLDTRQSYLWK